MISKYIKIILFYNRLIRLKSFFISHIIVFGFYISEIFAIINTFTFHNEDPAADYIIEFSFAFTLSHLLILMMFGALAATLFCLQILIKLFFKKIFTTNNEFLLNNQIYHCFWVLGSYISIILATCALLYIIHITGEGLEWLYDKYWK